MNKYWTKKDFTQLDKVSTYHDLYKIAANVLERMPRPRAQICGPISTGGTGSVEENLKRFEIAIEKLISEGMAVFNQLPFEMSMQKIKQLNNEGVYDMDLLEDFYLPIFENKLINVLYFLPDWKSSVGARWENKQALRIGLTVKYLEDKWGQEPLISDK